MFSIILAGFPSISNCFLAISFSCSRTSGVTSDEFKKEGFIAATCIAIPLALSNLSGVISADISTITPSFPPRWL